MTVSYTAWFSILIKNGFFNGKDAFTDCYILPADDTRQQFFTGTNWLQKFIDDTLYVLVKSGDDNKPAISISTEKFFRFYLLTSNYNFYNYTNIDNRIGKGYILYLSNFANNKVDNPADSLHPFLNLSKPIELFSASASYVPGDLVTDGTDIYECILKPTTNAITSASWLKRDFAQSVSSADVLPVVSPTYRYKFGNDENDDNDIISFTSTITGFKVAGNVLVPYQALTTDHIFPQPVKEIQVDLSSLPPGRYQVNLTAVKASDNSTVIPDPLMAYYDNNLSNNKALAVVEVFNCIAEGNDYAFQSNEAGKEDTILKTGYLINFANRLAYWNYIFKATNTSNGVNATVAGINFSSSDSQVFKSDKALPFFKEFDYDPFTVSGTSPSQQVPWPSATVLKLEKETDGSIKKFFTEVYLNY